MTHYDYWKYAFWFFSQKKTRANGRDGSTLWCLESIESRINDTLFGQGYLISCLSCFGHGFGLGCLGYGFGFEFGFCGLLAYLFVCLFVCLFVYLFVCLHVSLSVWLAGWLAGCFSLLVGELLRCPANILAYGIGPYFKVVLYGSAQTRLQKFESSVNV